MRHRNLAATKDMCWTWHAAELIRIALELILVRIPGSFDLYRDVIQDLVALIDILNLLHGLLYFLILLHVVLWALHW